MIGFIRPAIAAAAIFASAMCFAADELPEYRVEILPGSNVSNGVMTFQAKNSVNSAIDTYQVDFANRKFYRSNENGTVMGGWTPDQDQYINPSVQTVFCLAGPIALAACGAVIVGPLIPAFWLACEFSANNAVTRLQNQCSLAGKVAEITDTGVCGMGMVAKCIVPTRISFSEP